MTTQPTQPRKALSVQSTAYECGTKVKWPLGMPKPEIIYTGDAMKKHLLQNSRKLTRMKLLKLSKAGVIIEMASKKLKEGRG